MVSGDAVSVRVRKVIVNNGLENPDVLMRTSLGDSGMFLLDRQGMAGERREI